MTVMTSILNPFKLRFKTLVFAIVWLGSILSFSQEATEKSLIETTLNNYIDAFYKGDTTKLKAAVKPRLYKFGYWKNEATGAYDYYAKMDFQAAMTFVSKVKSEGRLRPDSTFRAVEVLDIGNHIAAAKVSAAWGIDYMLLSKDDNQWKIEQVIWEGPLAAEGAQNTTTYYLIRHAEKDRSDASNRNPHLNEKGKQRAENWADYFKDISLDLIYSTDYFRTKETAYPTAKSKDIDITLYNPRQLNVNTFLEKTKGKTVLIVGHSNTTPALANKLLGKNKYQDIDDNNNANLYKIEIINGVKTSILSKIE